LGNDTIYAENGDTVSGGGGRDLFIVNGSSAYVVGNVAMGSLGGDTLQSSASYDLHQAENINNLLYTGTLGASLTGNGVTGSIIGGVGADTIEDGGADATGITMIGGAGNDLYLVNSASDLIVEASGGGTDTVLSSMDYSLASAQNVENLALTGMAQAGYGNAAANSIKGNDLGDTLVGGDGSDTLFGGDGNDVIFAGNATFDVGLLNVPEGTTFDGTVVPLSDGSVLVTGTLAQGQQAALRYTKAGLLDTAFGTGGYVAQPNGFQVETLVGASSGKILVGGTDSSGAKFAAQYTASGQLDTTFGNGGLISDVVALLGDGSFLTTMNGGLARYTSAGKADTVNGGAGGALKTPNGSYMLGEFDRSFGDGSFIVNGMDGEGNSVVIHYLAGGKLDAAYPTPFQPAYLADGSFLADAGNGLAYFKANGQPDTTNGYAVTGALKTPRSSITTSAFDQVFADGSFIVSGWDTINNNPVSIHYFKTGQLDAAYPTPDAPTYLSDGSFLADAGNGLARFKANGQADTAVGANGVLKVPTGASISDIAFTLADGSYFFNGTDPSGNAALLHYSKTFALDTAFGIGGYQTAPDGVTLDTVIQISGGKYQVAGTIDNGNGPAPYYAQYTPTGQLDTTFGNGGVLTAPVDKNLGELSKLSDGSFLIAINDANGNPSFVHYTATGQFDLGFGADTLGADSLVGGVGDDTLVSGPAVATLDGGAGNNTFYVNNSSVLVRQSTLNGDSGTILTSVSYDLSKQATNIATLIAESTTGVKLTGNALNDSLVGGSGTDSIIGGSGNDTIQGYAGTSYTSQQDILTGGTGSNTFVLGESSGAYYRENNLDNGDANWAVITDFKINSDQLVLSGSPDQYTIGTAQNLAADLVGKTLGATGITVKATDLLLEYNAAGGPDIIAGIRSSTGSFTANQINDILSSNASYV
jgi:uncharacterized delta-60 repeat protein